MTRCDSDNMGPAMTPCGIYLSWQIITKKDIDDQTMNAG